MFPVKKSGVVFCCLLLIVMECSHFSSSIPVSEVYNNLFVPNLSPHVIIHGSDEHNDNDGNDGGVQYNVASGGDASQQEFNCGGESLRSNDVHREIESVIRKLDTLIKPLNDSVELAWSSCRQADQEFLQTAGQAVTNFNELTSITGFPSDQTRFDKQQAINSSVSYLRCYSDYIGRILHQMTNTLLTEDVTANGDDERFLDRVRQAVYDSYENVTVATDINRLVEHLACVISSSSQTNGQQSAPAGAAECIDYDDLKISYEFECFKSVPATSEPVVFKQMSVIARVTYFLIQLTKKLHKYSDTSLQQ